MTEDHGPGAILVPDSIEKKDLLEHYWYCSKTGLVVVEPTETSGKESCWILPINTEFASELSKKTAQKRELFWCQTHYLDRKHYKQWTKGTNWPAHPGVKALFDMQPPLSLTVLKSKFSLLLYLRRMFRPHQ